jgi:DNA repair protein RAD5
MESGLNLFREVVGEQADDNLLQEIWHVNGGNVERAIDMYLREASKTNAYSLLMNKRKEPVATVDVPKYIGIFEAEAIALSSIQSLTQGTQLYFKLTNIKNTQPRRRNKETIDKSVRILTHPAGTSIGKLAKSSADVLFPLLHGNLVKAEAVVTENIRGAKILDSFRIAVKISFYKKALCDPSKKSSEEMQSLHVSSEEYYSQRQAFIQLIKLLDLTKTQETAHRRSLSGPSQPSQDYEGVTLPERDPAITFTTSLYPYQKQALAWMLNRELGSNEGISRELHELWEEYRLEDMSHLYFNPFTGQLTDIFPESAPRCRGGILADEMGLGKTVMVLSLIHTHIQGFSNTPKKVQTLRGGTLIVVPLTLMSQWMQEAEEHGRGLNVVEYYASKGRNEIRSADIVLTTYGTLGSCFSNNGDLFKIEWFRVVLDEGHNIRNRNTQTAKACLSLKARHKWIVTGTPIQNALDDLYTLISFLDLEPWSDYAWWNKKILQPSSESMEEVLSTIRSLLKPIMLRRTKVTKLNNGCKIIDLPSLNVHTVHIRFSPYELELYNKLYIKSRLTFNKYLNNTPGTQILSIFELLLRLRQVCDHPYLLATRGDVISPVKMRNFFNKITEAPEQYVDELLDQIREGSNIDCPVCLEPADDAIITPCAHVMCRPCAQQQVIHNGNCPLCKKNLKSSDLHTLPRENKFNINIEQNWISSSKVDMLIHLLKSSCEPTVVFTQWTSMIDLLHVPLSREGINYLRLDGSMTREQRRSSLEAFREGRSSVFLLSLKAGGVGLNLTTASRVVIFDPWWNPAIEQQAIERVHRIGQTRAVTAIKLICSDTVEEKILELHSYKQSIIEGTFTGEGSSLDVEKLKFIFGSEEY